MNAIYPYLVWCMVALIVVMLLGLLYLGRQIALVYKARHEYEVGASKLAEQGEAFQVAYSQLAEDCHILYFALAHAWSSFRVMKDGLWHIYISLPTGLVVYAIPSEQNELFDVIPVGEPVDEEITPIKVRERLLGTAL